jgi:hypothetical protein
MAIFGKKSEQVSIPIDQIIKLRQQGLSDDLIVQTLQKDGFKSFQIFEAMHQADVKGMIAPTTLDSEPAPENPMQMQSSQMPPMPPQQFSNEEKTSVDRIEEIAEAIIDEKWNELVLNVNKIIEWKEEADRKIMSVETQIKELGLKFDKVQSAMSSKLEEYDKTMIDVGTDVKALTKVFQKVLPGFIDNVNELSRITERAKTVPPKKTLSSIAEKEHPEPGRKTRTDEIFGE